MTTQLQLINIIIVIIIVIFIINTHRMKKHIGYSAYNSTTNVNKNPTRCNSMQIFIYCEDTLNVSGVTARSGNVGGK